MQLHWANTLNCSFKQMPHLIQNGFFVLFSVICPVFLCTTQFFCIVLYQLLSPVFFFFSLFCFVHNFQTSKFCVFLLDSLQSSAACANFRSAFFEPRVSWAARSRKLKQPISSFLQGELREMNQWAHLQGWVKVVFQSELCSTCSQLCYRSKERTDLPPQLHPDQLTHTLTFNEKVNYKFFANCSFVANKPR